MSSAMPLAADRNPPPVEFLDNATDEKLAARLTARPTYLSETRNRAAGVYNQARALPEIGPAIDAIWSDFQRRNIGAVRSTGLNQPPVGEMRVALEAIALFGDFLSLGITYSKNPLATRGYGPPQIANTPAARELLNSRPATKAWLAKRDAAAAAVESAQLTEQERQAKNAPRVFLENMRARGVHPELGDDGSIIVPPGTDMSKVLPGELRAFTDWKPELVALLQAEADVSEAMGDDRPRVLA